MTAVLLVGAASALRAQPATALLDDFYGNTLICHNKASGAICQLWLNADGSYYLMYDRGRVDDVPMVGGIFRLEGREGRYVLKDAPSGRVLCLKPNVVRGKTFQIERSDEMFGGPRCYPFSTGAVGSRWTGKDRQDREVQFWLVKGRG